jgi:GT2 family glycosyltransferase
MNATVAVIIVGYNSEAWLEQCLAKITGTNWESDRQSVIIYIDNASSDDSVSVVSKFSNVTIVECQHNMGFGVACNIGAEIASSLNSDVLCFLNPDVLVAEDTLLRLADVVRQNERLGAVGPLQRSVNNDGSTGSFNEWTRRTPRAAEVSPIKHAELNSLTCNEFDLWLQTAPPFLDVQYANGACLAIRTELFERLGGFNPAYFLFYEEVDLCRRIRHAGYRVVMVTYESVAHVWGGHSAGVRLRLWLRSRYFYVWTDPYSSLTKATLSLFRTAALDARRGGRGYRIKVGLGVLWTFGSVRRALESRGSRTHRSRSLT